MEIEAALEYALRDAMDAAVLAYERTRDPVIPETLGVEILDALTVHLRGVMEQTATETLQVIGETKDSNTPTFDRIIEEYVRQFGAARVTQITATTRNQMLRIVTMGVEDGLSVEQIAAHMREIIPALARIRAETIARTETHTASQHTSLAVAKVSGVKLLKKWTSVSDPRTRDFGEGDSIIDQFSHRAMNGQTVPLDMPFMAPKEDGTFEPLMFPGDPNASPGNTINCRCAMTYERDKG